MGFDAARVVEPLDYDFSAFEGGKGTIAEPTDKMIESFFRDLARLAAKFSEKVGLANEDTSPEELLLAISSLPDDASVGLSDMLSELAKVFARLCRNNPSTTQISKLPMRIKMRFFVWLSDELRPEGFGADSRKVISIPAPPSPGPIRLRSVQPG